MAAPVIKKAAQVAKNMRAARGGQGDGEKAPRSPIQGFQQTFNSMRENNPYQGVFSDERIKDFLSKEKGMSKLALAGKALHAASGAVRKINEATGGEADSEAADAVDGTADALDRIAEIKGKLEDTQTISDEDLKAVLSSAGLPPGVPSDWDKCCEVVNLNTGERRWIDPEEVVLEQIANHLHNHLYTYNEDAKDIDAGIDTETVQVGPTAQEIEKVNPAAVKEVNGAKVVDTAKLAMTLAGALGEMARKVRRIEDRIDETNERTDSQIYLGKWGD